MKQDYNLYLFLLEQMNCPKHCTWGKHQQVGNNCCFNRYIFSISVSSVPRLSYFPLCPVFKQFLDEVFVISGMIKVEVSVTSRAEGQGSTLTETLIIPEYHKKQNIITVLLCIVLNKNNNNKHTVALNTVWHCSWKSRIARAICWCNNAYYHSMQNLSSFSLAKSPPRDLQITADK